jgi:hypothetical protein
LKLILQAIKSLFRGVEGKIARSENTTVGLIERVNITAKTANNALGLAEDAMAAIADVQHEVENFDMVIELINNPSIANINNTNLKVLSGTFSDLSNKLQNGALPRVLLRGHYVYNVTQSVPLAALNTSACRYSSGSDTNVVSTFMLYDAMTYTTYTVHVGITNWNRINVRTSACNEQE